MATLLNNGDICCVYLVVVMEDKSQELNAETDDLVLDHCGCLHAYFLSARLVHCSCFLLYSLTFIYSFIQELWSTYKIQDTFDRL